MPIVNAWDLWLGIGPSHAPLRLIYKDEKLGNLVAEILKTKEKQYRQISYEFKRAMEILDQLGESDELNIVFRLISKADILQRNLDEIRRLQHIVWQKIWVKAKQTGMERQHDYKRCKIRTLLKLLEG